MSTLNKIVVVGVLAIGMQVITYASDCKKEIETIMHFSHELFTQENIAEASEVAQWLGEGLITHFYHTTNIIAINAIITGDYSMNEKIAYLIKIKKERDAKEKRDNDRWKLEPQIKPELKNQLKHYAIALGFLIISAATVRPTWMIGDDLGKRIVAWFNKSAPVASRKPGHADDYAGATN